MKLVTPTRMSDLTSDKDSLDDYKWAGDLGQNPKPYVPYKEQAMSAGEGFVLGCLFSYAINYFI